MSVRRLLYELKEAEEALRGGGDGGDFIDLKPCGDDLYNWTAKIKGVENTPYEEGTFTLKITCAPRYPFVPPAVTFVTPIFHPNVNFTTGEICLDVLTAAWSPAWSLLMVCRAINALMSDPNADSPLNCDAGNLVRNGDVRGYESMARMYTIEHAT
eukprot:Lankesteria_metandrocarpae@DN4225_c0_g1_i1.p1